MIVGVGASPRPRPVHAGQGRGAVDHLHRRARRDRPPARRRRVARRPRRARADAQPDPHRDGRLHGLRGRHRPGRDQPTRCPRRGAAAPRPLRPPRHGQPARRRRAARRSSRSTRARCRWPTTSTSRASPPRRPGMVGADLRNLVNEAALGAAGAATRPSSPPTSTTRSRRSSSAPSGASRSATRSASAPPTTRAATRCSGMLEPGADPVRKVSIVPRGRALGVTFQSPESDRYGYDTAYLRGRIVGALGGRAAEEIVYGVVTTGAESDLEQVTQHRALDGRPLGHVGGHRPGLRPAPTSRSTRAPIRRVRGDARADRPRGPPDRRRVLRPRRRPAAREPRAPRRRWPPSCWSARRSTRTRPTRPPASSAAARRATARRTGCSRSRRCAARRRSTRRRATAPPSCGATSAHPRPFSSHGPGG